MARGKRRRRERSREQQTSTSPANAQPAQAVRWTAASERRRGVVLLVVLSLLVLFVVVGLTFAIVASTYRRTSESALRSADRWEDSYDELDRSMYQLLRDTTTRGPMQGHSLLMDLYGVHSELGQLASGPLATPLLPILGGDLFRLTAFQNAVANPLAAGALDPFPDTYAGCVLTFLSGPAAYRSARIVSCQWGQGADGEWGVGGNDDDGNMTDDDISERAWPGSDDRLVIDIEPVDVNGVDLRGGDVTWGTGDDLMNGSQFLISAKPFSGTGVGSAGQADLALSQTESYVNSRLNLAGGVPAYMALLPNFSAYPDSVYNGNGGTIANAGGPNEDWDIADFQNLLLSHMPLNPTRTDEIIPSFHRPALVRYWFNWLQVNFFNEKMPAIDGTTTPTSWQVFLNPRAYAGGEVTPEEAEALVALKRMIIMRPLTDTGEHPNFTGSNPGFNLENFGVFGLDNMGNRSVDGNGVPNGTLFGQWDVDNDGDGIPDSIWIDPMFPVKTAPDGRKYKTLIAVMVQDLDGRLNINAHDMPIDIPALPTTDNVWNGGRLRQPQQNRRGSGVGPAEISLSPLDVVAPGLRTWLLNNRYRNIASDRLPGHSAIDTSSGNRIQRDDILSYFKNRGLPSGGYGSFASLYRSPPDMFGLRSTTMDRTGQPMTYPAPLVGDDAKDDPYEANLLKSEILSGYDSLFTVAELEPLLRFADPDVQQLPQRLRSQTALTAFRNAITTISRHVPVAGAPIAREKRSSLYAGLVGGRGNPNFRFLTILDMYRSKLLENGVPLANVDAQLSALIPFEMQRGELFDLNRAVGNGRDDNGNNTVDEPLEMTLPAAPAWQPTVAAQQVHPQPSGVYVTARMNQRNDDPLTLCTPHQIYARHLYCLVMLLKEDSPAPGVPPSGYNFPGFVSQSASIAEGEAMNNAKERELTARRLAQWAVNVIDYRDSDAVMTIFEYDANPWNGWGVDGDVRTNEGGERRVVIGCEEPDLVMTESLAFHDRRVRDTNLDASGKKRKVMEKDDDLDQFRLPQGSLFIELYATRNYTNRTYNNMAVPAELYSGTGQLDLGRMAPARAAGVDQNRYPVWRIGLSNHHTESGSTAVGGNYPQSISPEERFQTHWATTSFQAEEMGIQNVSTGNTTLPIERYIWMAPGFSPQVSAADPIVRQRTYYNRQPWPALLQPGQYAVVGPRVDTYLGSMKDPADPTVEWAGNSPQRIRLAAAGVQVSNVAGATTTPALNTAPALALIADRPRAGTAGMNPLTANEGVNVTEPYPSAATRYDTLDALPNEMNDGRTPSDQYNDWENPSGGVAPDIAPAPLDSRSGMPLQEFDMLETDTYTNVRSAFLQRLADPTLPWNPFPGQPGYDGNMVVNPYVTVDWTSIDATVFTGEENTNRQITDSMGNMEDLDPDDPFIAGGRTLQFGSTQRGLKKTPDTATRSVPWQIWSPWTIGSQNTPSTAPATPQVPHMTRDLYNTVGYLNAQSPGTAAADRVAMGAPNYVGFPNTTSLANEIRPNPWLKWNNRPFASPLELMQVPSSSPARLMMEISNRTATDFMTPSVPGPGNTAVEAPYRHLMNFYLGRRANAGGGGVQPAANLFRLLDYVHTPSPFVGTETWLNPQQAFNNGFQLRPPHNRVLKFREPGRINLNTIAPGSYNGASNTIVWNGLMHHYPDFQGTGSLNQFLISRQGYGSTHRDFLSLNAPALPTRFANPFRSANSSNRMPPVPPPFVGGVSLQKFEVDATLLRSSPTNNDRPLFHNYRGTGNYAQANPPNADRDTIRHAAFAYEGLQRLGNLTTTRSNAFAVWITTGYFEATPRIRAQSVHVNSAMRSADEGHLDGYQLGAELGSDTGNVRRRRAFYIIDRSIPVGFQPGQNHNVDRAVLLRRIIE